MEGKHLSRLQTEQAKAINETDTQIEQIEHFKNDYKALQDRLKTLPDKLTHDVMVPIGKLALMPGKLVHTNEIMVLLGDNWFAQRTAKQASDIAGRRVDELNQQISKLKTQRGLLEPRLEMTSDLQNEAVGHGDVKEIVEAYDPEKERLWDEQHRRNIRKQRDAERLAQKELENAKQTERKDETHRTDTDLWARLDALEKEEEENREFDSFSSSESLHEGENNTKVPTSKTKGVQWTDETLKEPIMRNVCRPSDSDDSGEDEEGGSSEESNNTNNAPCTSRPVVKTIRFSHSDSSVCEPHQVDSSGDFNIQSPADVYKLYSPASILKKGREGEANVLEKVSRHPNKENVASVNASKVPDNIHVPSQGAMKAFCGQVKEVKEVNTPSLAPTSSKAELPRRVSKFKAMRTAQKGPT